MDDLHTQYPAVTVLMVALLALRHSVPYGKHAFCEGDEEDFSTLTIPKIVIACIGALYLNFSSLFFLSLTAL